MESEFFGILDCSINLALHLGGVHTGVEGGHVEVAFYRSILQRFRCEVSLGIKDPMKFFVSALPFGAESGLCCRESKWVYSKWKLAIDNRNIIGVLFLKSLENRNQLPTVGAFEVGKADDLNRSTGIADKDAILWNLGQEGRGG